MNQPQIKERKLDLVLIGDLNPHIFQPEWFVVQKLLGEKEGASAKVEVIHSDIAVFELEWLRLEVTRSRLVATTKDDRYHEILRDLIIGAFTVLSHTPLKMVGINITFNYLLSDEKVWHSIGDQLAPKGIWKQVIDTPGLRSLAIESKSAVKDNYKNIVSVAVSPTNVKLALRIHINDHYELTDLKGDFVNSSAIIDVLRKEWDNSKAKADGINNKFFEGLS